MPSRRNRKSTDPVAQAVARWLKQEENREYDERERLTSIEKRMEENREESKLFAKFVKAAMADGKTMRQAMDEWNARQNKAKAENEAKRQAEAAIFEKEYRARLAASCVPWEAFERAERAVAHARWEAKRLISDEEWRQNIALALSMGNHERLGARSKLQSLTADNLSLIISLC